MCPYALLTDLVVKDPMLSAVSEERACMGFPSGAPGVVKTSRRMGLIEGLQPSSVGQRLGRDTAESGACQ